MKVFLKSMIGILYVVLYSIPIGIVYLAYLRFAGKKRIFPSR